MTGLWSRRPRIRRMCGGGVPSSSWRELRRVDGAVIWDRAGWALAWRGDWGRPRLPRFLSPGLAQGRTRLQAGPMTGMTSLLTVILASCVVALTSAATLYRSSTLTLRDRSDDLQQQVDVLRHLRELDAKELASLQNIARLEPADRARAITPPAPSCAHTGAVDVESTVDHDVVLARWCPDCSTQLEA